MSSVREYYLTSYTKCPRCDTFLCTWQEVAYTFHSITIFSLPFYIFGGYCILYKTPKEMSSYRIPLFNFHIWTCLVDIFLNVLATPYLFFPTLSGFSVGFLNFLRVPPQIQVWLVFQSLNWMLFSMTMLLENRHNSIPFNRFQITKKRTKIIYYLVRYLSGLIYSMSLLFFIPEGQNAALLQVLAKIPCPSQEFFTASDVFVLRIDENYVTFLALFTGIGVMTEIAQIVFFLACCVYYLFFSVRSFASRKTRQMQVKYFASIILQISIPMGFMMPTVLYMFLSLSYKFYNQALTNLSILHASLHGSLSTFMVLIIHAPYRHFILSLFKKLDTSVSTSEVRDESVMATQVTVKQVSISPVTN